MSLLRRITEIQKLLSSRSRAGDDDPHFLDFRDHLFPASGFQSAQFRLVENKLGLRPADRMKLGGAAHTSRFSPDGHEVGGGQRARAAGLRPGRAMAGANPFPDHKDFSFWDAFQRAVKERLEADLDVVESNPRLSAEEKAAQAKDFETTMEQYEALFDPAKHAEQQAAGKRRLSHRAFQAALFITLYRDQPALQEPFRLLELLMDIDEGFTTWRYRHAQMVLRMIGRRIGTGGSAGAKYLEKSAERSRIFGDLYNLSTFLIPRADRPLCPLASWSRCGSSTRDEPQARLLPVPRARPDRLHFAAHSHHPWPDVSFEAQQRAWLDAAEMMDDKWDHIFGNVIPDARKPAGCRHPRARRPGEPDLRPQHPLLSPQDLLVSGATCRVLSTDAEFHSFTRQSRRWEEEGLAIVDRVPTEPFDTFAERFTREARAGVHDLIYLSQVFYDSGFAVSDLDQIVSSVPENRTFIVIDGYHAFMARPLNLGAIQDRVFFLAGGYKYAMSGEGACFLHSPPGMPPALSTPVGMRDSANSKPGSARRCRTGTMAPVLPGLPSIRPVCIDWGPCSPGSTQKEPLRPDPRARLSLAGAIPLPGRRSR